MKKSAFRTLVTLFVLLSIESCNTFNTGSSSIELTFDEQTQTLKIDNFIPIGCLVDPGAGLILVYKGKNIWEPLEKNIFYFLRKQNLKEDYISIKYRSYDQDKYGNYNLGNWEPLLVPMYVKDIKDYKNFEYFKKSGWSLKEMFEKRFKILYNISD